jgi:tRNA splicing ligase
MITGKYPAISALRRCTISSISDNSPDKSKDHAMMMKPEDFQKLGQANMDTTMKMFGDVGKNFQAIAAEVTDYSKKSFEDGTQTMEKLMASKSIEQAMEIQTTYAKRAYDNYMAQMTRVGTMYQDLAKEAVKPMASAFQQNGR